jgi:hypothetical protein
MPNLLDQFLYLVCSPNHTSGLWGVKWFFQKGSGADLLKRGQQICQCDLNRRRIIHANMQHDC